MTPDEALAEVENRIGGGTMYEGRESPLDEVLAAEVKRLRAGYAAKTRQVIELTYRVNALMATLDRYMPQKAREMAKQFERQEDI